jgi:RNA polymerase sigma-70 factor, ECF subfamily
MVGGIDFMAESPCAPLTAASAPDVSEEDPIARVTSLVEAHYDFVWRTLRHLGIPAASAEDGAQQVMCVLARRLADVAPGAERPFLFSTAMRVAANLRRTARRHPESPDGDLDALAAATPSTEELVDERRARALLDRVLEALPVELRIVFVLYEIEEMTTPEIAATLGIPLGTASSRLRRARGAFQAIVARMNAAQRAREGKKE